MKNLPFVVQPRRQPKKVRVGSDDAGYIEIEKRGYLTVGERSFVQASLGGDDSTLKLIDFARKLAKAKDWDLNLAYQKTLEILGGNPNSDPELDVLAKEYLTETSDCLAALAQVQEKEKLICSFTMLKYRINFDTEVEFVMTLHPDMIDSLFAFYQEESNRSAEQMIEDDEEEDTGEEPEANVEQIEKKPSRRRKVAAAQTS